MPRSHLTLLLSALCLSILAGCGGGSSGPPIGGGGGGGGAIYVGGYREFDVGVREAGSFTNFSSVGPTFDWFDANNGFLSVVRKASWTRPDVLASHGADLDLVYFSRGNNPDIMDYVLSSVTGMRDEFGTVLGDALDGVVDRNARIRPAVSLRIDPQTGTYYGVSAEEFEQINALNMGTIVNFSDGTPENTITPHAPSARVHQRVGQIDRTQIYSVEIRAVGGVIRAVILIAHEDDAARPRLRIKVAY